MDKIETEGLSAVFYIDGSCRPHNPGYVGWGVHGYYYSGLSPKPIISEQFIHTTHGYEPVGNTNTSEIIDDEGTGKNSGKKEKFIVPVQYLDAFGSYRELLTNNVAEIMGLGAVLDHIKNENLNTVRIYTDSMYLKDSINDWCKKWAKNNWMKQDGSPVSNRAVLEYTYNLFQSIKDSGVKISLSWIRAHTGHLGNERADVLAGIGMSNSQKGNVFQSIETSPFKGYWKSDPDKHPYLAFRRLYFNSMEEYNQPGVYYMAESPDSEFVIGKPSASTGYSVIYCHEPDPTIELVRKKQFEVSRNINVLILMKLDSVFSKQVYPWLDKHGDASIMGSPKTHSMMTVDKRPVTLEMNPTGLSLRAFDHFAILEQILQDYLKDKQLKADSDQTSYQSKFQIGAWPIEIFDITSRFFETIVDKKGKVKHELLLEFIVGYKDMVLMVDIQHHDKPLSTKIPYALGYDCLPRNNLKYLESANPKIYLLTWKENSILRYVTIIDSDFGVGIWSNFFANNILLPA